MKRNMSSESMTTLSPNSSDEKNQENNPMKDFETMLEGMDDEESRQVLSQKKRRLHIHQVRALEKNFEVDDKLDPDRKVKLAREVGLQPRQVAIWFQNRRARWKTKQMEKDYVSLKANYDNLKLGFEKLQQENATLLREISELKSKLNELSSKPGELLSDTQDKTKIEGADELNFDKFSESILNMKDGSSDSDSSAIFNDDNNNPDSSGGVYLHQPFAKLDFFEDESCGSLIFAEDQAPALHWYLE